MFVKTATQIRIKQILIHFFQNQIRKVFTLQLLILNLLILNEINLLYYKNNTKTLPCLNKFHFLH